MKLLTLYLRYGNANPQAFFYLQKWQQENLRGINYETWIIDNALTVNEELLSEFDTLLVAGDNRMREFSGWDQVIAKRWKQIEGFDIVHFVTETFNTLYTGYLEHFHPTMLEIILRKKICLGHIDCYDQKISILGHQSQHWIRTCFFFLEPKLIKKIGNFVSFYDQKSFFDEEGNFLARRLSGQYIRYLIDWLSGKAIQGVRWHSTLSSSEQFRAKVMAIINEHFFSIRMRKLRIRLVDFCWFFFNWQNLGSVKKILGWEKQIAYRRQKLFEQKESKNERN